MRHFAFFDATCISVWMGLKESNKKKKKEGESFNPLKASERTCSLCVDRKFWGPKTERFDSNGITVWMGPKERKK